MATKPKERVTLDVRYKRGNLVQPLHVTQNLDHLGAQHFVREMDIERQGYLERDGKQYMFQTIRFLIEVLE